MFILYLVIIFYIIIFNVLIPLIVQRLDVENQIYNSTKAQALTKITCVDNYWFFIDKTIYGLKINYLIDKNGDFLTCDKDFEDLNEFKQCGFEGEFNNRYNPCLSVISQLLYYRDS